ncbi:MAG: class I SAM-dependent methyltransferase [bacterium]|nr:class I SAM-dependent methyltransferase [bacterium]
MNIINLGKLIGGREGYAYNWIPYGSVKVLDIGCGYGGLVSVLVKNGKFACGVDIELEFLKEAKKVNPKLPLILSTSSSLPFRDSIFDVVTALDVIELLSKDNLAHTIAEIVRVLKPHSLLIVSIPHKGLFYWLDPINLKYFTVKLLGKILRYAQNDGKRTIYNRHFTLREAVQIIGSKFSIESIHCGGLLIYPLSYFVIRLLDRLPFHFSSLHSLLFRLLKVDFSLKYGNLGYNLILLARKDA